MSSEIILPIEESGILRPTRTLAQNSTRSSLDTMSLQPPCVKGKRRNPKTKRCRKICAKGHRRNEITKHCRQSCRQGFTRSRKNNRCVKN